MLKTHPGILVDLYLAILLLGTPLDSWLPVGVGLL